MVYEFIIYSIAGIGAGLGTGFAGMSVATAISSILITFLHIGPYEAVGIALASDVLASTAGAYIYDKNRNLGIPNDSVMMVAVLCFTLVGSWAFSLVPSTTVGGFSVLMALLLSTKFIAKSVTTVKESAAGVSREKRITRSIACGIMVGFICGSVGASGGMMMLFIPTSVLGYELKTAVGIGVLIMTFTALAGTLSHFTIGDVPDIMTLGVCVLFTLLWARIIVRFANRTNPVVLSRVIGVVLAVLGITVLTVNYLS